MSTDNSSSVLRQDCDVAWCPGCGNFAILKQLDSVFQQLSLNPLDVVMVSGIGQAAKIPQYIQTHFFNGLHGRALPVATAIKASNRELTVIAESGDGDMYGEGGNHFIHCIRRNPNITNIVHNNMVYGLTKGQASPTSQKGFKTPVQVEGVILEPFNPIAVAISLGASFVARAFAGHPKQTVEIICSAIRHPGYALIDILQPCVTFNKINTFSWFDKNTEYLEPGYDDSDRVMAFSESLKDTPIRLGIFYQEPKEVFEEQLNAFDKDSRPLYQRKTDMKSIQDIADTFR